MSSSSFEELKKAYVDAVVALDEGKSLELWKKMIDSGVDVLKLLDALMEVAQVVGDKYERGEFFTADLVMAGEIMKECSEMLKPLLEKAAAKVQSRGRMVIGTVEGDIHDIGKNIFVTVAQASGIEMIDLGVDVPPQKFVEAIKQYNPDVVGMSGLLTLAIESMKRTVEAIKAAGLRDKVKIIIGGGRVDETAMQYVGADAWTRSAFEGLNIILKWLEERRRGGA